MLRNKLKISEFYFHQLFDTKLTEKYEIREVLSEKQHRILWPLLGLMLGIYALTVLMAGEFNRNGYLLKNVIIIATSFMFLAIYFLLRELTLTRNELVFVAYLYIIGVISLCLVANKMNRITLFKYGKK